jgi:hypothetical protein
LDHAAGALISLGLLDNSFQVDEKASNSLSMGECSPNGGQLQGRIEGDQAGRVEGDQVETTTEAK